MVGSQDLFFLCFRIALFWLKYTTLATIFAPILLATTTIVPVLDNVLTAAMSTLICYGFCYHPLSLSPITYFVAPPACDQADDHQEQKCPSDQHMYAQGTPFGRFIWQTFDIKSSDQFRKDEQCNKPVKSYQQGMITCGSFSCGFCHDFLRIQ